MLLSVGAKVLGNIEVGEYSRVGAGSVVLKSVPAGCTAVGVPAVLGCAGVERPSQEMDQLIDPAETGLSSAYMRIHNLEREQRSGDERLAQISAAGKFLRRHAREHIETFGLAQRGFGHAACRPYSPAPRPDPNSHGRTGCARTSAPKCGMRVRVMPTVPRQA